MGQIIISIFLMFTGAVRVWFDSLMAVFQIMLYCRKLNSTVNNDINYRQSNVPSDVCIT